MTSAKHAWYYAPMFALLFTVAMTLIDTLDGLVSCCLLFFFFTSIKFQISQGNCSYTTLIMCVCLFVLVCLFVFFCFQQKMVRWAIDNVSEERKLWYNIGITLLATSMALLTAFIQVSNNIVLFCFSSSSSFVSK